MPTRAQLGVVGVEAGKAPILVSSGVDQCGDMDTTLVLQTVTGAIFNPVVLAGTSVVSAAFLTGGAARLVEWFERT